MAIDADDSGETSRSGRARAGRRPIGLKRPVTMIRRIFGHVLFSSLTRRILSLNLLALYRAVLARIFALAPEGWHPHAFRRGAAHELERDPDLTPEHLRDLLDHASFRLILLEVNIIPFPL